MTTFIRLLDRKDKEEALLAAVKEQRDNVFDVEVKGFLDIPGAPFSYWASDNVREAFVRYSSFLTNERWPSIGASTKDDFRYLRVFWEVSEISQKESSGKWRPFAKGGAFSKFYSDIYLSINWGDSGKELKASISEYRGSRGWGYQWSAALNGHDYYFRPALTWPRRTNGLGFRVLPEKCIFADKGPSIFVSDDSHEELLLLLAIMNSSPFNYLVSLQLARTELAQSFEVGLIQQTPVPEILAPYDISLANYSRRAWSLKRTIDSVIETTHAFLLPEALRECLGKYDPSSIRAELVDIQGQIDEIAFELYGFSEEDRLAAQGYVEEKSCVEEDGDDVDIVEETLPLDALLAWTFGVGFGRFDWRLATGEREAPPEPEPFDPLPAKSPGMLPDGDEPYHRHAGILVDDTGHEHDLPRLMADVLETVDAHVDEDLRRWLRRDFFKYHLQQYSKSRRKAPIYWPLATASGSYTLWLYYPDLTNQTLFTAVNDFVEPKLKQVDSELSNLRLAGVSRSRADEKRLEELSDFRDELADLRDTLLRIAPDYKPNHDDGVQITAAPLWPLFRHKPWQKVLKETWEKLEQGDYDWAHLAMAYWPERVREKCVTDKSLAIAHDLEHLYVEPEPVPKKTRGRKKNTGSSE